MKFHLRARSGLRVSGGVESQSELAPFLDGLGCDVWFLLPRLQSQKASTLWVNRKVQARYILILDGLWVDGRDLCFLKRSHRSAPAWYRDSR